MLYSEEKMYCKNCGSYIDENVKYCAFCGKKVVKKDVASISAKVDNSRSKKILTISVIGLAILLIVTIIAFSLSFYFLKRNEFSEIADNSDIRYSILEKEDKLLVTIIPQYDIQDLYLTIFPSSGIYDCKRYDFVKKNSVIVIEYNNSVQGSGWYKDFKVNVIGGKKRFSDKTEKLEKSSYNTECDFLFTLKYDEQSNDYNLTAWVTNNTKKPIKMLGSVGLRINFGEDISCDIFCEWVNFSEVLMPNNTLKVDMVYGVKHFVFQKEELETKISLKRGITSRNYLEALYHVYYEA